MFGLPSEMYILPSSPPPIEYSLGCILSGIKNTLAAYTKYLHFFEVSAQATLFEAVATKTLGLWILDSAAGNRSHPQIRLLPILLYQKMKN